MYVEIALTVAALTGMLLMYMEETKLFFLVLKGKLMLRLANVKKPVQEDFYYMPKGIKQILERIITVTLGIESKGIIYVFWIVTIGLPVLAALILERYLTGITLMMIMVVLSGIPLVLLIARLTNLRIRNSKEGKLLLVELLDNYKINYYNMQHAIEITATTIEEAPNTRKLLFNLSKGLNRARSRDEIRNLLDNFKYAIGTSWSGILADNIYFALSAGIRVENAMEDLIKTIAIAEEIEERSKRENNEAGLILKYLIPLCYLMSIVGGVKFFGLTLDKFLYYQFQTMTGISWFVAVVVLYVISLIMGFFLTQNKLDL